MTRRTLYRVIVEGRNCLIDFDGKVERHGFFATRFVYAEHEQDARSEAIENVRLDLQARLLNQDTDLPTFDVHHIQEAERIAPPNSGFTWYPESEFTQ